jgi:hypothetical protein
MAFASQYEVGVVAAGVEEGFVSYYTTVVDVEMGRFKVRYSVTYLKF